MVFGQGLHLFSCTSICINWFTVYAMSVRCTRCERLRNETNSEMTLPGYSQLDNLPDASVFADCNDMEIVIAEYGRWFGLVNGIWYWYWHHSHNAAYLCGAFGCTCVLFAKITTNDYESVLIIDFKLEVFVFICLANARYGV